MPSQFPSTLAQLLNSTNFTYRMGETRVATDMDVGPAKLRSRFTRAVDAYDCEMDINISLIATFQTFYKTTLGNGTLPFMFPDPFTQVVSNFRFAPGSTPQIVPLGNGGTAFTIKMSWEILP
jgi:hypothetical protein